MLIKDEWRKEFIKKMNESARESAMETQSGVSRQTCRLHVGEHLVRERETIGESGPARIQEFMPDRKPGIGATREKRNPQQATQIWLKLNGKKRPMETWEGKEREM